MKRSVLTAGLAAAATVFGFSAGAWAQGYYDGPHFDRPYPAYEGRSVQQEQQQSYGYSGTAGRMGLGASPRHPEGPGNVTTPSR